MSYIKGIDISNNNGSINFSSVKADGVEYVYVKSSEGATFKDRTMKPFYNECKSLGLKVGAYHFLVGTSSPEAQAQNFYSMIKDYDWDLIPMMDVETNFSGLANYVERFIVEFKKLSPLTLGIYSYTSFIEYIEDAKDIIKDMPFWEANYNNKPWNLKSNFFTNRIGHQYTETGSISGISEKCDVDSFTEGVLLSTSTIPGTWVEKDTKWWYKHNDGSYTSNGWEYIDGKWYCFDNYGYMLYDWKKDGNNWYYLGHSDDGSMKTGWILTDSKWYYFGDDGAMRTGWEKINEKWYYFDHTGAMKTGWIKDNGNDYCLYSDGSMIQDTVAYGYKFNTNGHATKC